LSSVVDGSWLIKIEAIFGLGFKFWHFPLTEKREVKTKKMHLQTTFTSLLMQIL
jgi:hypothetical protein